MSGHIIRTRHKRGLERLQLHGRAWKDAASLLDNPPTPFGLAHSGSLDCCVPREMLGADVRQAVEGLPTELVRSTDNRVDTQELARWIEEHGTDELKHAWQWLQLECLVGT